MNAEIINLFDTLDESESADAGDTRELFPDLSAALYRLTIRPKP